MKVIFDLLDKHPSTNTKLGFAGFIAVVTIPTSILGMGIWIIADQTLASLIISIAIIGIGLIGGIFLSAFTSSRPHLKKYTTDLWCLVMSWPIVLLIMPLMLFYLKGFKGIVYLMRPQESKQKDKTIEELELKIKELENEQ